MSVIALPKNAANNLRELGPLQDIPVVRQLGLFALVAATIGLGLWLFFWTQRPDYVPVFAGMDGKSTTEASDLLRAAQIPFRIDPSTGALAVPGEQLGPAKLALASAGLPAEGGGFESLQGDQGFGTSQFVESARYQHALETELARTIANLRPVREARVHLAIPKPSAFTRQKDPASASVVLHLGNGSVLEAGQVNAIVHLVANSIPQLSPESVTVVDQFGRMLSNPDPDSESAMGAKRFEQQQRQEAVYVQRIQELLAPLAGPGRVSAQVSVDMDFSQTEQAREQYGPEPAIVRSEQISESGDIGPRPPQGVPGAAANTPEAAAAAAEAAQAPAPATADGGQGSRTAVRNYEIDRTLTHTRQAPGRITRVTAAVLVDNVPGAPDAEGKVEWRALTADELARIESLVQRAIGFDDERGDMVTVVNAPFARNAIDEPEGAPFWQHPRTKELLRIALGGLAVLALIFTVLRPAFRQLIAPAKPRTTVATLVEDDEEEIPVTLSKPKAKAPAQLDDAADAPMNFDEKLQVARTAVSSDPKRVANVVRSWVEQDG
ncbi:flagellar basal-body MS-ring/collar protein FliF [Novilysobacter spongiicola]|uniref:Flagellar M-ring protein n=1 Tax=Lysobacter spongiicola DSM 21749 TaxID=1122188 RepID=A0A1T4S0E2_9GAMM|nr:flagellar basal-body MS-ring/collar protein FliF [Lysobacter spongiicola]SKA21652.1 flagellar M-ring protein FliF [Lysobacter spongiicola DSM 21749]